MTETYEILAIKYGEFINRRRYESFIGADDHDGPHPITYYVWLIRSAHRTILVDCGFNEAEGAKRGRRIARTPAAALEMLGVGPSRVDQLIVSHLHYDHAGTMGDFPNAHFHVQAAEMAYATGPCMCHNPLRYPFTADHVCEMVRNVYSGRVTFHDGDGEVAPGITVHKIGGHSRGLQAVRVMTAGGGESRSAAPARCLSSRPASAPIVAASLRLPVPAMSCAALPSGRAINPRN